MSWIVERVSELWGGDACWEIDNGVHPHEDHILKLDIAKARDRLDWSPKIGLNQALEWVVEWYKAYQEQHEMQKITEAQIARYESLAISRRSSCREPFV